MKTGIYIAILLAIVGLVYWQREPIETAISTTMGKLTRSQFIQNFASVARIASKNTGLFPSVFLAQAILESGNGNSSLSREANNYFGIKADPSWTGAFVMKDTREYINGKEVTVKAPFRAYPTPLDSFRDRVNFLIKNKRYSNAGVFVATTPEQQAQALLKAGYATDPEYANKLISLINSNNLKQYDYA